MTVKEVIKRILGIYDYDRYVEKLIYKSIKIYHSGGKINMWRGIRLYNKIRRKYNCHVCPSIVLGKNPYIAHAQNLQIGKTAIIGDNCRIYPNVSIIAAVKGDQERYSTHKRTHAKIGNNCLLGTKCLIIGPVNIGNDVTIGAGAIVTKDVPDHTVVKNVNQFRKKREDEKFY